MLKAQVAMLDPESPLWPLKALGTKPGFLFWFVTLSDYTPDRGKVEDHRGRGMVNIETGAKLY